MALGGEKTGKLMRELEEKGTMQLCDADFAVFCSLFNDDLDPKRCCFRVTDTEIANLSL